MAAKSNQLIVFVRSGSGWRVTSPMMPDLHGEGPTKDAALLALIANVRPSAAPMARQPPRRPKLSEVPEVLQLKVTLRHVRPPIWRRLLVEGSMMLNDFHDLLQAGIGWTDSHLHAFEAGGVVYQLPQDEFPSMIVEEDERDVAIGQILRKPKDRLRYDYDFGDGWEHDVVVEKTLARDAVARAPALLAGKGACPPEDVGGSHGYDEFRRVMADPSHPEHGELREWWGAMSDDAAFDAKAFDVEATDAVIAKLAARRTRARGRNRRR